ncbi:MAG TPA: hypothetical protein DDY98_02345 [Ruminococcaceae bacterium]|nr:hypothetical protein [Oscillospiraceae bacterium]
MRPRKRMAELDVSRKLISAWKQRDKWAEKVNKRTCFHKCACRLFLPNVIHRIEE